MADFCHQCSVDIFGEDYGDLAGITPIGAVVIHGKACVVICEGCGVIQVDSDGWCISDDCMQCHGLTYEKLKASVV